jgi:hypothetical protein
VFDLIDVLPEYGPGIELGWEAGSLGDGLGERNEIWAHSGATR